MTQKIDKAGRVILPKPVRDRLGLQEGNDLEITETPEGIVLKRARKLSSRLGVQSAQATTMKVIVSIDLSTRPSCGSETSDECLG